MIGIVNEDIHITKGIEKIRDIGSTSTINIHEELNIKKFIDYESFDSNLQTEFNSIVSSIDPKQIETHTKSNTFEITTI